MGSLSYPVHGTSPIRIDDRTLAHLQLVIGTKLRLNQAFFLSWIDDLSSGGGRTSIWIDSAIQLRFVYDTNRRQQINRVWLESMMTSANSVQGLLLSEEPVLQLLAEGADRPDVVAA
jgi:hypothetical protein